MSVLPDDSVLVAVADPTSVLQSAELRRTVGRPVRFAVSTPDAVRAAITSARARLRETGWTEVAGTVDGPSSELVSDDETSTGGGPSSTWCEMSPLVLRSPDEYETNGGEPEHAANEEQVLTVAPETSDLEESEVEQAIERALALGATAYGQKATLYLLSEFSQPSSLGSRGCTSRAQRPRASISRSSESNAER